MERYLTIKCNARINNKNNLLLVAQATIYFKKRRYKSSFKFKKKFLKFHLRFYKKNKFHVDIIYNFSTLDTKDLRSIFNHQDLYNIYNNHLTKKKTWIY